MKDKFDKEDILLGVIIFATAVVALYFGNKIGLGSKTTFFLLIAIEWGIFYTVQKFRSKEEATPKAAEPTAPQSPMEKRFQTICDYCRQLEDANYDNYRIFPPVSMEEIKNWENEHQITLPKGYKDFLQLADGFEISNSSFYPLDAICRYPEEEYAEYYIIGSYIGDGSLLVTDKYGSFYLLDHAFGLKLSTVESFLDHWVIEILEDGMKEMKLL